MIVETRSSGLVSAAFDPIWGVKDGAASAAFLRASSADVPNLARGRSRAEIAEEPLTGKGGELYDRREELVLAKGWVRHA